MTETRQCRECHQDYEPEYYGLLGTKLIKGDGYCPPCAKVEYEKREARDRAAELADVAKRRRDMRSKLGIPNRFMTRDFSAFKKGRSKQVDAAFDICWKYAEEYPIGAKPQGFRSLYIYSEKSWGVGKTHLSCAIAHRLLDRWTDGDTSCPRIRWVSEPELFSKIEASFNYTAADKQIMPNKDDIINDLINADLLILDDVGKEKRADPRFVQRTLFAIINGRYDRDYPMVFTANLNPSSLKAHLGKAGADEASYDRLLEMCQQQRIQIDGDSYRRG